MTAMDLLPLPLISFISSVTTAVTMAWSSVREFFAALVALPRESEDVDPALLVFAALTFILLGAVVFALIAVAGPQIRHLAHAAF